MGRAKARPKAAGTLVGVRLQPSELGALDSWRKQQEDLPTRPEAVRRLLASALGGQARAPEPPHQESLTGRLV